MKSLIITFTNRKDNERDIQVSVDSYRQNMCTSYSKHLICSLHRLYYPPRGLRQESGQPPKSPIIDTYRCKQMFVQMLKIQQFWKNN